METAKEKADRLGVPLRRTPQPIPFKPNPLNGQDNSKDYLNSLMKQVSSVCETCGKELTKMQERPCGLFGCPFGNTNVVLY